MIATCNHTASRLNVYQRSEKRDPTRTLTLRNAYAREMRKRFRRLRGVIRETVANRDAFGIAQPTTQAMEPARRGAFDFPRTSEKVSAFMKWLEEQQKNGILEVQNAERVGESVDAAWQNKYVQEGYKSGVGRARSELRKAGYDVPTIEATGGIEAAISGAVHADRLGLLYTRNYEELKGITQAMDQQISRVLAEGIGKGDHPDKLARKLNSVISGRRGRELGITDSLGRRITPERRAQMLARTEIVRAHAEAQLTEYQNWKAEGVELNAEWVTAGDNRVCSRCESYALDGPYTMEQARGLIPLHPDCRCVWVPVQKSKRSKRTRPDRAGESMPEIRDLTTEESQALSKYKSSYYAPINYALRQGKKYPDKEFKKISDSLHQGLQHSPKYEGNAYRGMAFDTMDDYNEFIDNAASGNYMVDNGFMSASKSSDVASGFYNNDIFEDAPKKVLLKIRAKGKRGVDTNKVLGWGDDSVEGAEQEILFDKGSRFRIKSKKTVTEADQEVEHIELIEL